MIDHGAMKSETGARPRVATPRVRQSVADRARHRTSRGASRGLAAIVGVACFAVGGCNLAQPYQATGQFGLVTPDRATANETRSAQPAARHGAIRISRLRVNPPSNSRHFLYRMDEVTFASDYHNEFVAPPERLLGAALVDEMLATGPFASVIEPGGTADAALRLETTVSELHGDFRDLEAPKAVIRARFVLLIDEPATTRQIGEWILHRNETIPTAAPGDLAGGWSRAWRSMVAELNGELAPIAQRIGQR